MGRVFDLSRARAERGLAAPAPGPSLAEVREAIENFRQSSACPPRFTPGRQPGETDHSALLREVVSAMAAERSCMVPRHCPAPPPELSCPEPSPCSCPAPPVFAPAPCPAAVRGLGEPPSTAATWAFGLIAVAVVGWVVWDLTRMWGRR